MSKTNSLRCPLCGKGRIADIPAVRNSLSTGCLRCTERNTLT